MSEADNYDSNLHPQHAKLLAESGITPEHARKRGYYTETDAIRVRVLGITKTGCNVPGLVLPQLDAKGAPWGVQYRPDQPRRDSQSGKPIKYETPRGQHNDVDVPPGVGPLLADPSRELWITEGSRKADAAAVKGLASVALLGVWGWKRSNEQGVKGIIVDGFRRIPWRGRSVVLAFDSDVMTKPSVLGALLELSDHLTDQGARLRYCYLPANGVEKVGLDDFLVSHSVDELRKLVSEDPPAHTESSSAAKGSGGDGRDSVAKKLVALARATYWFGRSDSGESFAVPLTGPRVVRMLRSGKTSLRAALAGDFYIQTGKIANQQALADALLTLEGLGQDAEESELHVRVADVGGSRFLDLGRPDGQAVRITDGRWDLTDQDIPLFRRTGLMAAMDAPTRGGTLDDLWTLLNVAEEDRPLILAWLVAAIHERVPHPILAFVAEQGAAKTTATRVLASLIDPSPAQVRKPPQDMQAWVTAAAGSWVVALDNISHIPAWFSDSLCRAVTGDADARRRLYTDADYTVFAFRRCVILNGIDLGALRGDLAERTMVVGLEKIPEEKRCPEQDIRDYWRSRIDGVRGALFDVAASVDAVLPDINLDRLPRMADFARTLKAVDKVIGTAGLDRFSAGAVDLAADSLAAEPLFAHIRDIVKYEMELSAADLLAKAECLHPHGWRPPPGWPRNARAATAQLLRIAPLMRKLGWEVGNDSGRSHGHVLRWTIAPPETAESET